MRRVRGPAALLLWLALAGALPGARAVFAQVPLPPSPAAATPAAVAPLALAWGAIAEPEAAGAVTPGRLAEHLEFLLAHDWRPLRVAELAGGEPRAGAVLLSFDDPASALRFALPLLELYRVPAVVTADAAQLLDPALEPVLAALAASPWVELLPRVAAVEGAPAPATLTCGAPEIDPGRRQEQSLSALRRSLDLQLTRLAALGERPAAVAWSPGSWSGPGESVATYLGLGLQLPTFAAVPPTLAGPRVARYAVPAWAGVWALVQAGVQWHPLHHPVRFVEVDAAWVCAGGDPAARVARVLDVVRRLGLNGARILPGDGGGAWFSTTAAAVRGEVVGPLADALHAAGVRWVMIDLPPPTGDPARDLMLAADLARGAALDVAILPPDAGSERRLGEALRYVRPAVRLAGRGGQPGDEARAFLVEPFAPGQARERGLTVAAASVAAADRTAVNRATDGWRWLGLPVELAERGLAGSVRSLAAFTLPR